ncbi:hypothetical protein ACFVSQ_30400 [Streptomyces niveus]|uniref:hypothetical protein n=1 Tax=Streptomyces niveus TaxID=193462 RepID=UPI0036E084B4
MFCFSGDAFFWSNSQQTLEVAHSVVYDSIKTLADSVARGAEELTFEWVLPGHGELHLLTAPTRRPGGTYTIQAPGQREHRWPPGPLVTRRLEPRPNGRPGT